MDLHERLKTEKMDEVQSIMDRFGVSFEDVHCQMHFGIYGECISAGDFRIELHNMVRDDQKQFSKLCKEMAAIYRTKRN